MNNYQWLLQMDGVDRKAWFDAEHVEHQDRTLDGDTAALNAKIAELERKLRISWEYECKFQTERDELTNAINELQKKQPYCYNQEHPLDTLNTIGRYIDELTAERDNWKANCEDWKKHARAAENACYETMLEREDYRKKFGKCIDYADAIHALMDDEGMA